MDSLLKAIGKNQDVVFVGLIIAILVTVFVPLPPPLVDLLLLVSISVSVLVLLTVIYVREPLVFSVFPSVLLLTTAFRLAMNIATTRLILSRAGELGTGAAGNVVRAFGEFVARADVVIGLVIFAIIVIVNFVVITKGANRISEVAARFTLDAMPGKQMAIDADLNAGLIKEDEARRRRERIAREADFYGAMDGATKFVRGDAIAGIIITLINILGGLIIGTVRFGMSIGQALETFTILTVGDGLVSQVPALLVSLAAGLMVTRATAESNLGQEFIGQLTGNWKALAIAGGFVALVGLTPLPLFQSLVVGGILLATGYIIRQGLKKQEQRAQEEKRREAARTRAPERVDALLHVDPMDLEVGHGLLRLVDPQQGGPMLERITRIRRQMAVELGIQVPPIRIRDNIQLEPNEYVVRIRGTRVAKGELMPDMYLAMEGAPGAPPITGIPTKEPVFGLPAYWIAESEKDRAEAAGYTVVEPSVVMATHLTEIIKRNAADLLTREEVHALIKNLRQTHPSLVEEVVDKVVKVGEIQKVLQNLLREGVSIRDLATIVETLGDYGARVKDPEILTEYVRNALGRAITQRHLDAEGKIVAITLDPKLEDLLRQHIERTDTGSYLTMSPAMVQKVTARIAKEIEKATQKGQTPVILCSPQVRVHVRRLLEPVDPTVAVLSYNEITRDARVEAVGLVAIEG